MMHSFRLFAPVVLLGLVAGCSAEKSDAPAKPSQPAVPPAAKPAATPAPADVHAAQAANIGEGTVPSVRPAITPSVAPAPAAGNAAAQMAAMDAGITALMQKAEHTDDGITVQHILIAFQGAPRITGVTRSKDEAKALAAKLLAEVQAGGDFDALMKANSNDSGPGIYPMTKASRGGMVKGFGDVGWRLRVGEIGVAPWDATASPYGWHIIKRVK